MGIIIIHVPIFTPSSLKLTFHPLLRISEYGTFVEVNLHRMRAETDWVVYRSRAYNKIILISKVEALGGKKYRWAETHRKNIA